MKKATLITFVTAVLVLMGTNLNAQTVAATKLEPSKKVEKCENKKCECKDCDNCKGCTNACAKAECTKGRKHECKQGECTRTKGKRGYGHKGHCAMQPTEEALKNLKTYPETVESLERHVIYVGERKNEEMFKVELIPGKTMLVDCNQHRLSGEMKEETVQGWGYTYHTFKSDGQTASTMMMCPDPKTEKFVSGGSEMVRYNSRLPIVVYLPKGFELKYKIWSAGRALDGEQK